MYELTNSFGKDVLYSIKDLKGTIFVSCAACLSVYADALSWTNRYGFKVADSPEQAENVIVLGCQLTDLSILNDFNTIKKYMDNFPGRRFFMGGCFARRFDIEMPNGVQRIDHFSIDYQDIKLYNVKYESPYWVNDFEKHKRPSDPGRLFREYYPLRIGVGCKEKCSGCTIREVRTPVRRLDLEEKSRRLIEVEMHRAPRPVVLVSDSPSKAQVLLWISLALYYDIPISIRNLEPRVLIDNEVENAVINAARTGKLKVLQTPIRSTNPAVLKGLNRSLNSVFRTLNIVKKLRSYGVLCATNVIIDYKAVEQDFTNVVNKFDYVTWNPYWDGTWSLPKAEKRYKRYMDPEYNWVVEGRDFYD